MERPKLKMVREDVCTSISECFQKNFKNLAFTGNQSFVKIDKSSTPTFWLNDEFHGRGEYSVSGRSYLYTETNGILMSKPYDISGRVLISEIEDSPVAEFIGVLSARTR